MDWTVSPSSPPLLLTEKEVAQATGFSTRTLQKWRMIGEGPPFVRISARAIRYRRVDIDEWINSRLRTSTSDPGDAA